MRILRCGLIALCISMTGVQPASARVDIDINLSLFPELVPVPGYPVYYAPSEDWNYFFYDGMYWVYQDDGWYTSNWYNGPWEYVEPDFVPLYVLRVPVRYYRRPPAYFYGWRVDAPPRWGYRWGDDWVHRHRDWDRWDRHRMPAPAPLPVYQRDFAGDHYPRGEQQREIRDRNYHYQPRNAEVRRHYQQSTSDREQATDRERQPRREPPPTRDQRDNDGARQQNNVQRHEPPAIDRGRQLPPQNNGREYRGDDRAPQQWQQRETQQPQDLQQHRQQPHRDAQQPQREQPQRELPQPQRESPQSAPPQRQQRPFNPQQTRPQINAEHENREQQPPQHNERGQDAGRDRNNDRGRGDRGGDRDR